jgi:hypothetical protein
VLTILPIQLLAQLVNMPYVMEDFKEYLADPIKRYYPLCSVPATLFTQLTYKRKYIFVIDDLMKRMCYQGLLTHGPHNVITKEKVGSYLLLMMCYQGLLTHGPHDVITKEKVSSYFSS